MPLAASCGIPVHACNPSVGEEGLEFLFYLLGAHPELPKVRAGAVGAAIGGSPLMGAVVAAHQPGGAVQGQGDATVGATEEMAAIATEEGGGITAPVQEEQDLLPAVEAFADPGLQRSGKDEALLRCFRFLAKVHHRDLGKHALADAFGEREQAVLADLCPAKAFERGGS